MLRFIIGRIIFCIAAMLSTAALAADSAYPSQPIHIIVPYAAGSTGDMVVRLIAPGMEQALKGKIIIENRPGAGGNIGTNFVANAAPDGHTLLMAAVNNYAINQFVYRSLIERPIKPLAPVSKVIETPYVMYASGAVQVKDVQAFIALARERPGTFFYASSGVGTAPHLAGCCSRAWPACGWSTCHTRAMRSRCAPCLPTRCRSISPAYRPGWSRWPAGPRGFMY